MIFITFVKYPGSQSTEEAHAFMLEGCGSENIFCTKSYAFGK